MDRRFFLGGSAASTLALATKLCWSAPLLHGNSRQSVASAPAQSDDLGLRWKKLDAAIRAWWDGDLHRATEAEIRQDSSGTLLSVPFPYTTAGGSEAAFPEIYGWDTQFINLGLLAHERLDIVRNNILDQLALIQRFGMVPNGNRTFYLTRGQPPLLAWSVENYLRRQKDDELAMLAYPNLERAYRHYWNGPDHATSIGLSTCYDNGKDGDRELAAEAESGLDYTPIYDGDIRRCVPIHINCSLVKHAEVLSALATRFGWKEKALRWKQEADDRAQRINQYCWEEKEGFYFEYDYVRRKRLPFFSLNAFWPLWSGIASESQARRVAEHLGLFDRPYGLTFTDKEYPNPHPQFKALEWAYPESWPPEQIVVALALLRYGLAAEAYRINRRYIANVVTTWEQTGQTWERYNAVEGGHVCPVERTEVARLHGWSSASAVVIGRMLFS